MGGGVCRETLVRDRGQEKREKEAFCKSIEECSALTSSTNKRLLARPEASPVCPESGFSEAEVVGAFRATAFGAGNGGGVE